ncbi:cysteine desulfurase [Methanoculleus sp.]|uniref:aminotransferase class V-fold PLP-dependent enzyme n=1 Tax=Methanoculleus sp. TaxID=90427 RepID=UPI00263144F0|nr:cysteine desulfurase [Methanoculleus sp.]MDI6866283.1 cysteine desulfurase [Methanoculleus sp.]
MRLEDCRADFPLTRDLIYLDSAATSLTPKPVIQAMVGYDLRYRANVGRGVHRLTTIATHRYRDARDSIRSFIGGEGGAIAITRNTTEAIGMVAAGLPWKQGDRVVTTLLEHHSNLLPWLRLRKRGVEVDIVRPDAEGSLEIADLEAAVRDGTRLVAITHASNVLGTVIPVDEIAAICHDHGARLLVDGAQSAPHLPVDVSRMGCDYFCFSGHKMLGPTGTGALWMREPDIEPLLVGGGSIANVTADDYTLAPDEGRYEAGTPPVAGTIGFARAAAYLREIGMETVHRHDERLSARLIEGLSEVEGVRVLGAEVEGERIGVVSFTVDGLHPHEVAQILDEAAAVLVRSGHHCSQPLMEHLGLPEGTVRASTHIYNTEEEIDTMIATVEEIARRVA